MELDILGCWRLWVDFEPYPLNLTEFLERYCLGLGMGDYILHHRRGRIYRHQCTLVAFLDHDWRCDFGECAYPPRLTSHNISSETRIIFMMNNEERIVNNNENQAILYSPSWIDRLTDWIEKLPGSNWIYYFGLGLILVLLQVIVMWIEGVAPVGTIFQFQVFFAGVISFFLALFHYLDKWAGSALEKLRPELTVTEVEYLELKFRIITLPMGLTILASLILLALNFLTELITEPYLPDMMADFPISANLMRFIYLGSWILFGAFMYHTIHQLMMINNIYTNHTDINLFRMRPLYAFSNLSAFTAGSFAVIIYGFIAVNPSFQLNDPVLLVWILIFIVSAVVTFVWPQLGMHRLQVAEQERLLNEAYKRMEQTISRLHRQLDKGELNEMEELNFAIASLDIEVNSLKRVRTWPWEPETLQILITALALPLGLWFIQLIIERLFGS